MNTLEERVAKLKLTWVRTRDAFTTAHKGYGFVVYYHDNQNWLAVLPKETAEEQLKCLDTKAPKITGFWKNMHGCYTPQMFEIPVTIAFLAHVVESAFPEMLTL